ncbi:MAG: Bax inhibitor-1/YccA family protein, partial [Flavobacteriales bacterium]
MEERNQFNSIIDAVAQEKTMAKSFMANVFSYMFAGLLVTGFIAWYFADSGMVFTYLFNMQTGSPTPLYYIAAFAPLGFVLIMGMGYKRLSASAMLILFLAFATLMGVSLSTIFITYNMGDVSTAFFSASSVFAVMAVVGYTTTTDLTKLGNILYMGLIAILIAMVINFFMQSSMM